MTHRIRIPRPCRRNGLGGARFASIALAQTKLIGTVADPRRSRSGRRPARRSRTFLPVRTRSRSARPVDQPQLPPERPWGRPAHRRGDGRDPDTDGHAPRSGPLHVRLRPAQPGDARFVHHRRRAADAPPPPTSRPPTLTATVGPGATILRTSRGARVTRLKAGRYRIVVRDRSSMHNFHLSGPGVNKRRLWASAARRPGR